MADLPGGTVTFFLTDVEGSTRRWEVDREAMGAAVASLDAIVERHVSAHHGVMVKSRGEGDAHFCVFARPSDAVTAAAAVQRELIGAGGLPLRIAIHTGEAELRDADYYGPTVNRAARLRAIGYGGQTLVSASSAELVQANLPAGVSLRDLGTHRLKDLDDPERVLQVDVDGLPSEFGALKSLDVTRHNLPHQPTSFVGRQAQVADLVTRLRNSSLVTLTGVGGTGKTRLAVAVAEEALPEFPDGVWFVDLAPVSDPDDVVAAIGVLFGIVATAEDTSPSATRGRLATVLRDWRALIVIDNCEHLIAEVADVVTTLRKLCRRLVILATSREGLAVPGEAIVQVPSLGIDDESVRLFVERASLRRPYEMTEADAPFVREICRRLDGMPLAIELAAGKMRMLSPKQIAAKLDDRFSLLTGGGRGALPRQQTLEAAIDWSYTLLSDPERITFRRLAVFAGGFDLDAVEAVVPDEALSVDAVADSFEQLIDKSLVIVDADDQGSARYRLLESLRQYASAKLGTEDDVRAARDRHQRYYAGVARVGVRERTLGPAEAAAVALFATEVENFRLAIEWRGDAALALAVLGDVGPTWLRHGGFAIVGALARVLLDEQRAGEREDLGRVLRATLDPRDTAGAEMLRLLGGDDDFPIAERARFLAAAAYAIGDTDTGRGAALFEEAVELARASDSDATLAIAASQAAFFLSWYRLRADLVPGLMDEALLAAKRSGSSSLLAGSHLALARWANGRGERAAADSHMAEAIRTAPAGDVYQAYIITMMQMHIALDRRDADGATALIEELFAAARRTGDPSCMGGARLYEAAAVHLRGEVDVARAQMEAILGDPETELYSPDVGIQVHELAGLMALADGDLDAAAAHLTNALEYADREPAAGARRLGVIQAQADVRVRQGELAQAVDLLDGAADGDDFMWLRVVSELALRMGRPDAAGRFFGASGDARFNFHLFDAHTEALRAELAAVAPDALEAGVCLSLADGLAEAQAFLETVGARKSR